MIQLFSVNKSEQFISENIGVSRMHSYLFNNGIDSELTYLSLDKGIEQQSDKIKLIRNIMAFHCFTGTIPLHLINKYSI